jgi:hypothetical protein
MEHIEHESMIYHKHFISLNKKSNKYILKYYYIEMFHMFHNQV